MLTLTMPLPDRDGVQAVLALTFDDLERLRDHGAVFQVDLTRLGSTLPTKVVLLAKRTEADLREAFAPLLRPDTTFRGEDQE